MEATVVEMVSAVGFPIVAFLLMFFQANTTIKKNTEALRDLAHYLRGGR